ncbi:hypothetical protein HAZT_HAZT004787 [Hyalella azteca]|uniref:Uncharacterized protein n=1 Tax=Hyalella azteca TaxID=294128 RepID=A0A6A0HAB0_HYAAZ|nr:hypothetical protein HAZT_HAZT004787 [Hyalella azteca]
MAPIDSAQPDVADELEVSWNVNEIRRKTRDNIVNEVQELKAEEFARYYLFPYGINGIKEQRPLKITLIDYFQYRILGSDTRFQRNDYLFDALSMFEYYRVKSTISACGKKIDGRDGQVKDPHLYKTKIIAHSSDEYVRSGGRICLLKRRQQDKWINNYNTTLLKLWQDNMDIQPCGSNEAITFYIEKYMSKAEPTELDASVAQAIQ